ncbi:hypothetical protein HYX19_03925 [Candidatus Woesearchaeota archaeon]|nr:hypothetical protein [Candidatus Woesearchaeota archaeon]
MKKGQVTLFVILGIIILGVVSLLFYYKEAVFSNLQEVGILKTAALPPELDSLRSNIQKCVDNTFISGLIIVGLNGGMIVPQEDYLKTETVTIAYWNNYGKFQGPSLNSIGSEMKEYIEAILPSCVNLEQYKKFTFNDAIPQAVINLGKDKTNVVVNYKLTATQGDLKYSLFKPYSSEVPVRFRNIYNIATNIANYEIENTGKLDVTYLLSTGMNVDVLTIDNETLVYAITDSSSSIEGIPYIFNIASRFKK